MNNEDVIGNYWSEKSDTNNAEYLKFSKDNSNVININRDFGFSLRLLENYILKIRSLNDF